MYVYDGDGELEDAYEEADNKDGKEEVVVGDEGEDEELASRLKQWVGARLDDVAVKDEHKVNIM